MKPVPDHKQLLYSLQKVSKIVMDGEREKRILNNVSLDISMGEFCGITGKSGAGKSTLLHILGGIDQVSEGKLFFEDQELIFKKSQEMALFRRNIGFVFQAFQLISHFSVFENVAAPLLIRRVNDKEIKQRVIRALQAVNFIENWARLTVPEYRKLFKREEQRQLETLIEHDGGDLRININLLPHELIQSLNPRTYDTLMDRTDLSAKDIQRINQMPKTLSGGEKQRVAVARAVVNDPKVILADEPTGNLDTENESKVLDLLRQIHKQTGVTVIIVSHAKSVIKECSREIVLEDGQVIADLNHTKNQDSPNSDATNKLKPQRDVTSLSVS